MALIANAQVYFQRILSVGRLYLKAASGERVQVESDFQHAGTNLGFYSAAPVAKPSVSGSTGGIPALDSLLAALAQQGLITNNATVSGGTVATTTTPDAPTNLTIT